MPRVAIIGAGPAGSAAAISLAHAGFQVTLFEARAFPRTKVCGEFISPSATHLLESLLPTPALLAAGARPINTFHLALGRQEVKWRMPAPGWALSRASLDSLLVGRAREAGCNIIQPASIREARYSADHVSIELTDASRHETDLIIHADGTGRHDPAGPIPHDARLIAAKCHFRGTGPALSAVSIRAAPGAYIGTIRVEDDLNTCALVAHRDLVRAHRGDFSELLDSLWLGRCWTDRPEWLACPLPRSGYIYSGHPRSFRIGNAAGAVDPVGGEGIATALWSGARLAELLVESGASHSSDLAAVHSTFARAYRRRLLTRGPACRCAAWALSRPRLVRIAWPLLRFPSISIRPWYRLTGKPA
ncbi:MAG: FAD-dependent oxidoreductase [Phycisphaerales bacterium]|nr:FAD-dependent oxidoreductase [Phycisphaerales bacterium]